MLVAVVVPPAVRHINVLPGAASLSLSSTAPTVTLRADHFRTPAAANLILSSTAPLVAANGTNIQPPTGDLTFSSAAPTAALTDHKTISPASANLLLSSTAPTIAVAGVASWSQVASWTHSGNVTTVDFTSLSGTEFLVIGRGVALTSAGSRRIRISDDNGGTWFDTSGDYQDIDNAGVEANADGLSLNSASATTASDFAEHIIAANLSAPPKILERRTRTGFGASVATGASAINGIRIYATAGDFSAGTIRIYAR